MEFVKFKLRDRERFQVNGEEFRLTIAQQKMILFLNKDGEVLYNTVPITWRQSLDSLWLKGFLKWNGTKKFSRDKTAVLTEKGERVAGMIYELNQQTETNDPSAETKAFLDK